RSMSIESVPDGISERTCPVATFVPRTVRGKLEDEARQFGFASFGLALLRQRRPRRVKRLLQDDQGLGIVMSHHRISPLSFDRPVTPVGPFPDIAQKIGLTFRDQGGSGC